ncbi:hypothetical protein [Ferribacterium limneticum]|uniref:hypothetical protein n=1 Tax=Ferribacterium limneticum TaxID=76259 RepID=UPI001CFB8B53|nr:hypothetical protein [Ferribacterium limneticum]UCV27314.1 hypothetical protein KI617_13640 [Ferribacterium limneticum]UCV31231.1 hypothetical protein KI608_13640 [Ferribacterium limneticum]
MRTSSAAPGFFGGVEESGEARNFAEVLDGVRGLLHNLASLLLTDFWFGAVELIFNKLDNR